MRFSFLISLFVLALIVDPRRKTLLVKDAVDELLAMVSTHASTVLKEKLAVILAEFQSIFGKELFAVDTVKDDMFQFLAFHFTWYNRYFESVSFSFLLIFSTTDLNYLS